MIKKALVVGGTSGIGLSIALKLSKMNYDKVYIVGRTLPIEPLNSDIEFIKFDLTKDDYSLFESYMDIDTLIISAGFGKVDLFSNITEEIIIDSFKVNAIAPIRLIKIYYDKILKDLSFNCVVLSSISGFVSSPLFSVYASTKASLNRFIESVNIELEVLGSSNKILNVAPGYIKGTGFEGRLNNDVEATKELAEEIITKMINKDDLYIPKYDEIYKDVLKRYNDNPYEFGLQSYNHKISSGRLKQKGF